ncbi:hypothetical protein BMQ_pBM50046 (plasmid) [Priestia megaterium QM B1551]|uniref:Uncharacterized protein n=1 Tax=Priestia megaterium (strain ATCC 12872 / QMB1551) TaxID=545693 RepID=D5E3L0_PRIM1|nr:hypothetical protein BMQ_pBM50046 [Priestia megaterium QM B1551]
MIVIYDPFLHLLSSFLQNTEYKFTKSTIVNSNCFSIKLQYQKS